MTAPARWDDLAPRMGVGLAMSVVGIGSIWIGGLAFQALLIVAAGVMIWELARILGPASGSWAVQMAVLAALALLFAFLAPRVFAGPLLIAPILVGVSRIKDNKPLYAGYGLGILFAAFGISLIRESAGMAWVLWLVLVVIATDVAGYFAGRHLGGPKFWPRISPKKTWSGTAAGWIAALFIGLLFWSALDVGATILWLSLFAALAAQMGDIFESSIKRRMGVKDSSNLLPGHGGLMDRFDGMLGATLFLLLARLVTGVPGAT